MLLAFVIALAFDTAATKAEINAQLDAASAAAMALPNAAPGSPSKEQIQAQINLAKQMVASFVEMPPPPPPPPPPADMAMPMGIPNFAANPTTIAVMNGPAHESSTWTDGVPDGDDVVQICTTISVVCGQTMEARAIGVCGTLIVSGTLRVKDLIVYPTGLLQLEAGARIIIRDVPIDLESDPEQWGTSVIVAGKLRTNGSFKTQYVKVENVSAGALHFVAHGGDVPGDWAVGDEIFISRTKTNNPSPPGTSFFPSWEKWKRHYSESEKFTIVDIDGPIISLDRPTKYEHPGGVDRNGTQVTWPYVANLTRDCVIESENPNGVRGHVAMVDRADVHTKYLRVKNMGRTTIDQLDSTAIDSNGNVLKIGTNQIGRYPVHHHMNIGPVGGVDGGEYQGINEGLVVDSDGMPRQKWAVALHRSSWMLLDKCTFYNFAGGGVVEEDGCERNNTYRSVIQCRSLSRTLFTDANGVRLGPEKEDPTRPTAVTDRKATGASGFWFGKTWNITCEDCIVSDLNGGREGNSWNIDWNPSAYWFSEGFLPYPYLPVNRGDPMDKWVPMKNKPVEPRWVVKGGESFAFSNLGQVVSGMFHGFNSLTISDHTAWNMVRGYHDYWVELKLSNCKFYGDPDLMPAIGSAGLVVSRASGGGGRTEVKSMVIDNAWTGIDCLFGRDALSETLEDVDCAVVNDLHILPTTGIPNFVMRIVRPSFGNKSIVMWRGWTEGAPPISNFSRVKYEKLNNYGAESFTPNTLRIEQWGGKNYVVYGIFQASNFVIPTTPATTLLGLAGLTNQQAWDTKGKATYGSIAPCNVILTPSSGAYFCEE